MWRWLTLGNLADAATVLGAGVAVVFYVKARGNARRVVESHLRAVAVWAHDGNGWRQDQITLDQQIAWLNPTQTIFPIASGPALIQMTMGDRLTLGGSLIGALVTLNQTIESFNAVLTKAEALRTQHAVWLARIHTEATNRVAELRRIGPEPDLTAALGDGGSPDDMRLAARVVINLLTMLHTGLIGVPGGDGLCEAYRVARAEFGQVSSS